MKIQKQLLATVGGGFLFSLALWAADPNAAPRRPVASQPVVVERGPHHRVWQRTVEELSPTGAAVPRTRSFVELATGLHYQDEASGKWLDAEEVIEIVEDGAVARKTAHKVKFLSNLNQVGALEVLTPDGKRLRSRILGLAYSDTLSGQSVLFAQTKDCVGEVAVPNQVIYKDAFEGALAMARYTLSRAGIEQDIVFLETPPSPADFGLDPSTSVLQVWTEFFDPPKPNVSMRVLRGEGDPAKRQAMAEPDFMDAKLDFGLMQMGQGRAFSADEKQAQGKRVKHVPVGKAWGEVEGRTFLIEKVPYGDVKEALDVLPKSAGVNQPRKDGLISFKQLKGEIRGLAAAPSPQVSKASSPMRLASLTRGAQGFVMDYALVGSDTNYTFKGDTTYYVSGPVMLSGETIVEGGAVVKLTNGAYIGVLSNITCVTSPYRMAVFTTSKDNSVGEVIPNNSGTLWAGSYYCALALAAPTNIISNIRFSYSGNTIEQVNEGALYVQNCQFMSNWYGVYMCSGGTLEMDNSLLFGHIDGIVADWPVNLSARNLTVRSADSFAWGDVGSTVYLTNCLLVGVTNWGTAPTATNCTVKVDLDSGIFQKVGAGACYLATNSPYRDIGTTNVPASLLAELRSKTTYPPVLYENVTLTTNVSLGIQAQRDTNQPDLGYHYAALDYLFGAVTLNSNLTVAAGTALGWYRLSSGWYHAGHGLHLADGMQATFNGTVDAPAYWVRRNVVQECEPNTSTYGPGGISGWAGSLAQAPVITARFTRFAMLASDSGNHYRDDYGYLIVRVKDCELWGGAVGGYWRASYYTNCLFDRCNIGLDIGSSGVDLVLRNCTVRGNTIWINRQAGTGLGLVRIRETIFDGTTVSPATDAYSYDASLTDYAYNAFTNNADRLTPNNVNDKLVANFNFQVGPLGRYYLPTDSALLDAGSWSATNVGLYHFTTQTSQVKETNSIVDIGYHYVALAANGQPCDTDGDGLADYIEDANGNGVCDAPAGETNWTLADTDGDGLPDPIDADPWSFDNSGPVFNITSPTEGQIIP